MELSAEVFVAGNAVGQGSLRSFAHPKTGKVVTPQSKNVRAWRGVVAECASKVEFWAEAGVAVDLELWFQLPRPKSYPKRRNVLPVNKRADIDKLERSILDALTGVWFADDGQVVSVRKGKRYAWPDERPGVRILARVLPV